MDKEAILAELVAIRAQLVQCKTHPRTQKPANQGLLHVEKALGLLGVEPPEDKTPPLSFGGMGGTGL